MGAGLKLSSSSAEITSLSAAAVSRLPIAHYAVDSAVNQATRQIGSVLGATLTVALVGHAALKVQTLMLCSWCMVLWH